MNNSFFYVTNGNVLKNIYADLFLTMKVIGDQALFSSKKDKKHNKSS